MAFDPKKNSAHTKKKKWYIIFIMNGHEKRHVGTIDWIMCSKQLISSIWILVYI